MTDDLVKRLRGGLYAHRIGDAEKAADRIEKLEAALRDCMEMAEVHEIPFRDRVMYISDIASKALGGKGWLTIL
jgi:hypothetical protein